MIKNEQPPLSFEEAMEQLEEVVEQLEQGDVPLEEAISMFQKGMNLSKVCHEKLATVEKQMDQILKEDGNFEETVLQEEQE
ncbi:exodeoxyribonuclease VII small subunit [Halalkalibacterium halodurans]|jgi:exodeoxyribonuclease VII small subunit|uniref:Exodeoxyribonuclease 7 small subunit n=2 Tax=Halalkalibacterium halodurans TaxID=86665 RepID=EX7S_HALH5|nr:exodeoxyribonuclease VII small subunit [Halalkalibacterium halodurans]Q9K968.1 RecName: Full=Exodeoxyribonuclease 7 small subunit; AltName: Full=Exodeoxyribonuclease VII small subunit; Short=Exonuclease VII small subunit [Halalkalibacterium halodurans C-125]MDY7223335.1 exodeoxyribonuclease VII small subunit [Halalkalibacterium halodurans]MDY7242556.1 exodeoxyribonuclease VII small subunit [Halalkalibacterium halodurans]MED3646869.1 exodeoxyribonuclease VII small subunit [Halalkalibacterium 